jgi:hypothetical protein
MDPTPTVQPAPYRWPWSVLLAMRPMPAIPPHARSVFLWGPFPVHAVALRSAARAVASGHAVALIDGDMAFDVAPMVAMAQACRVPPETFLRRIHLVRAFTCWQLASLFCEGLEPLLACQPIGLVILMNPLTHFFDQDVTFKEATFLLARVLKTLETWRADHPRVLLTQTVPPAHMPRRLFGKDLLRVVEVGLRLNRGVGHWSVDVVKPGPWAPGSPSRRG